MKKWFANFIRKFKERSKPSRRINWLFLIAIAINLPLGINSIRKQMPIWLLMVGVEVGSLFTIAAIFSLAFDHQRAKKLAERQRTKPIGRE